MFELPESRRPPASPARRLAVRFEGRVQGVGFRYTAEGIALALGVAGYVMNLPDGDVELVAEASDAELQALLERIQQSHLGRLIVRQHVHWSPAQGSFTGFRIRHC